MSNQPKHPGGGRFDPADSFMFFFAGVAVAEKYHDSGSWLCAHSLAALDYAAEGAGRQDTETRLARGDLVLLDSGIFMLAMKHAREHGVQMSEALALHPSEIDGFDWLRDRYVAYVKEHEADLWGYIELDQGGAERKRETRAWLESQGVVPIPVYHPLNDGWDYLDELMSTYDRVAVGNLVQTSGALRRRLLATLWERHREYPDVWVHYLGVTPDRTMTALPANSADSTGYTNGLRYGAIGAPGGRAMNGIFGRFSDDLSYIVGDIESEQGHMKATAMMSGDAHFHEACWRAQWRDLEAVFGMPPYPERWNGEAVPEPGEQGAMA